MNYELFYLVGESKEADLEKIKAEIEKLVSSEGGEFYGKEVLEKRKMAYDIKKERRGTYVARRFKTPGRDAEGYKWDILDLVTKKLNLYHDILRFIIVNADELPELEEIKRVEKVEKGDRRDQQRRREVTLRKGERKLPEQKKEEKKEVKTEIVKEEKEAKEEVKEEKEIKKEKEVKEEKKVKEEKVSEPKKKESGKAKVDEDEIDKKLDEILNI